LCDEVLGIDTGLGGRCADAGGPFCKCPGDLPQGHKELGEMGRRTHPAQYAAWLDCSSGLFEPWRWLLEALWEPIDRLPDSELQRVPGLVEADLVEGFNDRVLEIVHRLRASAPSLLDLA
jgi:hypothetical protein